MSSAAGPMVPVRTGSWLLRPVAPSVSSNVVSVLPLISTAAFFRVGVADARLAPRRHERGGELHGPCAESRRGLLAGRGGAAPRGTARPSGVLLHHLDKIAGPGLTLGIQTVQQPQLFLLELLDRHVLGVVLDLRLPGG